jgi:hypothetical protein
MQTVPLTLTIDGNNIADKMTNISFIVQAVDIPEISLKRNSIFFSD